MGACSCSTYILHASWSLLLLRVGFLKPLLVGALAWRILLYVEDIAILGDLATLWSLDYDALVLVDVLEYLCYTWRILTMVR